MNRRVALPSFVLAFAVSLAAPFLAQAQLPATEGKTVEQTNKNIKVLRGTSADSFNQTMHLISGELGVDCEYCHLEKDRVSDQLETKRTARQMIRMMNDLNKKSFNGKPVVSCYTCHRGSPKPLDVPLLPVGAYLKEDKSPEPKLPSADEIIAKYIDALGGQETLQKVTSRVVTATQDIPTGPGGVNPTPAKIERYQKAPNLMVNVAQTPKFTLMNGFDGSVQWAQDVRGQVNQPVKLERIRAARAADFYEPLHLKQQYTEMKVNGIEKINDRDAYVVVGYPQENIPERLYFDVQSGLLVRKVTLVPTAAGNSPFRVDYDDYRATNSGAKYPFVMRMEPAGPRVELATHSTIRVQKVEDNVAIDDSKFVKPVSKPLPPKAPAGARPKPAAAP